MKACSRFAHRYIAVLLGLSMSRAVKKVFDLKRKVSVQTDQKAKAPKKKISQKDFDRKIKIWGLIIPLIVALLGSFTAIYVAYFSAKSKIEYKVSQSDQLIVSTLSKEMQAIIEKYRWTQDVNERRRLELEFSTLSESEANLLRKYIPDYLPRPPLSHQGDGHNYLLDPPALIIKLSLRSYIFRLTVINFAIVLLLFFLVKFYLDNKYEVVV